MYQKITFIYKNKYLNRVTIRIEKFVYAVFNLFLPVISDFVVLFIRSIIIPIIKQFVVLGLAVRTKILKVLFRPSYSARFTPITYRMNTSSTLIQTLHPRLELDSYKKSIQVSYPYLGPNYCQNLRHLLADPVLPQNWLWNKIIINSTNKILMKANNTCQ